jgi:hypothetical protein
MTNTLAQERTAARAGYIALRKQSPQDLRLNLKAEIDTWPIELLYLLQEFALFEKHRLQVEEEQRRKEDIARGTAALERLKKFKGRLHLDKPWKEELKEAFDEKYEDKCGDVSESEKQPEQEQDANFQKTLTEPE